MHRYPGTVELADVAKGTIRYPYCWKVRLRYPGTVELADF